MVTEREQTEKYGAGQKQQQGEEKTCAALQPSPNEISCSFLHGAITRPCAEMKVRGQIPSRVLVCPPGLQTNSPAIADTFK